MPFNLVDRATSRGGEQRMVDHLDIPSLQTVGEDRAIAPSQRIAHGLLARSGIRQGGACNKSFCCVPLAACHLSFVDSRRRQQTLLLQQFSKG
jgi:hypothetical protein